MKTKLLFVILALFACTEATEPTQQVTAVDRPAGLWASGASLSDETGPDYCLGWFGSGTLRLR